MKKREISESETRVRNKIKQVISIYGIAITAIYTLNSLLKIAPQTKVIVSIGIFIAVLVLTVVVLFLVHGKYLDKIVMYVNHHKKHECVGLWELTITHEVNGKTKYLNTHFELEETLVGYRIHGSEIRDVETNVIEVKQWFADNVELRNYENKKIFIYTYSTYKEDFNDPTKLGLVTATCTNRNYRYEGHFRDVAVDTGLETRIGKVHFKKIKEAS